MRLTALLWVLGGCGEITVLYLGPISSDDARRLRENGPACRFHALPFQASLSDEQAVVRRLCANTRFDVCVIERIGLHFVLDALPAGIRTVLDSHDLESDNAISRTAAGVEVVSPISFELELEHFSHYDRVMLIQEEDFARVGAHIGDRAILAPHPVPLRRSPLCNWSRRIGLLASAWSANLHGLDWFADAIWPRLALADASMHLYGWIADIWRPEYTAFTRHGFVADTDNAWDQIDVAVNPVLWGSGLKIKNVEALGRGLPLVTTSEGARGLRNAAGDAFLVADDPDEFAKACRGLLDNPAMRQQLGDRAHDYARRHFSPEACFGDLLDWIG